MDQHEHREARWLYKCLDLLLVSSFLVAFLKSVSFIQNVIQPLDIDDQELFQLLRLGPPGALGVSN